MTQSLEAANSRLTQELDEIKREYDAKVSECQAQASELKVAAARAEAGRELQAKLEMETHQLADELDISR